MSQHSQHNHPQHDHQTHEHHHPSGGSGTLTDRDKLRKMIEHWIDHNVEHAKSFEQWAERARDMGEAGVADIIDRAARDMTQLNETFAEALTALTD